MTKLREWIKRRQDYLPPARTAEAVGTKVVHGSFWSGFSLGAMFLIQFVRSVVFARLLAPSDFGVIGLGEVFTHFILIFANIGLTASVIYRKTLDKEDLSTCWWGSVLVDGAAGLVCVVAALASRQFTATPVVGNVMALLATQYMLVSLGSVSQALMQRLFMFRQSAMIVIAGSLVTFAVALVAIAVFDLGVYGLVIGNIAGAAVMAGLRIVVVPWLPSSNWSWGRFKQHFRYGRWLLGVHVVNYVNGNADRMLIAGFLTTTQLGYYDYAATIPTLIIMRLGTVLSQVLFPAFASLQDNLGELRRLLIRYVRTGSVVLYPVLFGLGAVSEDFVRLAYGPKWLPIVAPLQIFCVVGVLRTLTAPLDVLCNSQGKPALAFKANLTLMPVLTGALYLAVTRAGVTGAAAVKLLFPILALLMVGRPIFKHVGLPTRRILAAAVPGTVAALLMVGGVVALHTWTRGAIGSAAVRLVLDVVAGMSIYVLALAVFWPGELRSILELARRMAGAVGYGAAEQAEDLEVMR